eukprot:tig00001024_g6331.t1
MYRKFYIAMGIVGLCVFIVICYLVFRGHSMSHRITNGSLREQTETYVRAFNSRSLDVLRAMMAPDYAVVEQYSTGGVRKEGRDEALAGLDELFRQHPDAVLRAVNVLEDLRAAVSVLEFELVMSGNTLRGMESIRWENGKMTELRVYVDVPDGNLVFSQMNKPAPPQPKQKRPASP